MLRNNKPDRLPIVINLHLKGYNQSEIAKRVGVSNKTISEDLKEIKAEWRANSDRNKANIFNKFMNQFNLVLKETWEAIDNGDPKFKVAALKLISDTLNKMAELEGMKGIGSVDPQKMLDVSKVFYEFIQKNPMGSPEYAKFKKEVDEAGSLGFDDEEADTLDEKEPEVKEFVNYEDWIKVPGLTKNYGNYEHWREEKIREEENQESD